SLSTFSLQPILILFLSSSPPPLSSLPIIFPLPQFFSIILHSLKLSPFLSSTTSSPLSLSLPTSPPPPTLLSLCLYLSPSTLFSLSPSTILSLSLFHRCTICGAHTNP